MRKVCAGFPSRVLYRRGGDAQKSEILLGLWGEGDALGKHGFDKKI